MTDDIKSKNSFVDDLVIHANASQYKNKKRTADFTVLTQSVNVHLYDQQLNDTERTHAKYLTKDHQDNLADILALTTAEMLEITCQIRNGSFSNFIEIIEHVKAIDAIMIRMDNEYIIY